MREDSDLTQKQIANYLHCSQQVYSNYELGQRDIPTAVLIALAKFYKTSTDYILGLTDERWKISLNIILFFILNNFKFKVIYLGLSN